MFNPSRQEVRQFFFDTWQKYHDHKLLTPIETIAVDIIMLHPEYKSILENKEKYLDKDYLPEFGETNPFLHMSMHLAINEQLSINQPPGIKEAVNQLLKEKKDQHIVLHNVMDCLAETLWQAQLNKTQPDSTFYLTCLKQKVK